MTSHSEALTTDQHYMRNLSMSFEHDVTGYPIFRVHGMSGDQKRDMSALNGLVRLFTAAPTVTQAARALLRFRPGNDGPDGWVKFKGDDRDWDAMADEAWARFAEALSALEQTHVSK